MSKTCPYCGGYLRAAKPKRPKAGGTVNPFDHPYPHARLYNNKLTAIARLSKPSKNRLPMIENDDPRNYRLSAPHYDLHGGVVDLSFVEDG